MQESLIFGTAGKRNGYSQRPKYSFECYSIDDSATFECASYSNTNAMQCAACEGGVLSLERLIGIGAALDYSTDQLEADGSSKSPEKPLGCTPLLIAVIRAIFLGYVLKMNLMEK